MKEITGLDYLKLTKGQRFAYKLKRFLLSIPLWFKNLGIKIWRGLKSFGLGVAHYFVELVKTFKEGDYKTRVSFFVMGFGSIARKQILRGVLFALFELVFIIYMISSGGYYLYKLGSLGMWYEEQVVVEGVVTQEGVNSFNILLFGVMTIFFIIAFLYTWNLNIKQNRINEQLIKDEKKLVGG